VHAKPEKGKEPAKEARVNLVIFAADGTCYNRQNVLLWTELAPPVNEGWAEYPGDSNARKAAQEEAVKTEERAREAYAKAAAKAEKEAAKG
jgi:hypothetical protein